MGGRKEDARDNVAETGILFASPDNEFLFPHNGISNHTAEYEAVIASLELALQNQLLALQSTTTLN